MTKEQIEQAAIRQRIFGGIDDWINGAEWMQEQDKKLIEAQDEYIKFLADYISENATFLYVHGIFPTDEQVQKGDELRNKIEEAKK